MNVLDFLSKLLKAQAAQGDYLPKVCQHVSSNLVHYLEGYVGFVIRLEGLAFDGVEDNLLFNHFVSLRNLFNGMGKTLGNRLALWTTLQRQKIDFSREYAFQNQFCASFAEKYLQRFQSDDYYENIFHITVLIKVEDLDDTIKEAEEQITVMMQSLQVYDPYLLTAYQNQHGIAFSEVYEFFGSLVNGRAEAIPLTTSDAYQVIASSNLHFGTDICEIRPQHSKTKFAVMYDLKDFGISKAKILVGILNLPFAFTLTQSFTYINSHEMQATIQRQIHNLTSVNDKAHSQMNELLEGQGELSAGHLMFGNYHAGLVVYGDTAKQADQNGSKAYSAFLNAGGYRFVKATMSAPATYFSQVPGAKDKPRVFPKTTTNLATTFGMHNYAHGKSRGNPIGDGSAIMPLQTTSKTLYDFNFHASSLKEDSLGEKIAGHTLILGATGTGKTTLQTALLAFTSRFKPHIFAMDLDRGMEIFMRCIGGSYFALEEGKPTGMNPFQLPDTKENREFLYNLVGMCGKTDTAELTAEEKKQIVMAVDSIFELPHQQRNFSKVLHSISASNANSLRERLSIWCHDEDGNAGRYAWCLDNATNLFNPEEFHQIGFDLTSILKDNCEATAPVLAYVFHLRNMMMDKVAKLDGLLCSIVEEFWYAARFPALQEVMLKMLKTDRKRGGWLILVSQSPEDAIGCPIFAAIVQQTPTKIFLPNPDAEYSGSYEKCGLTEKEFDEMWRLTPESRTFLVKQSKQSALATLNLYGFTDEIPILSGSSDNVELLHQVMFDCNTTDVDVWYPVFIQALRDKRAAKKQLAA